MAALAPEFVGFAAGLATSALWVATSIAFTAGGRRLGPTAVNVIRLIAATVLLAIIHRVWQGYWIPEMNAGQMWLLALSGLVGLTIGDQALFTAFVAIGPRLAQLIMTTAPIFAATLGALLLDERLGPWEIGGIAVTVLGVAWVVAERPRGGLPTLDRAVRRKGILLAFVGAFCQAAGLLLSKQGMGHGWLSEADYVAPQPATLTRIAFAAVFMAPILWWRWRARRHRLAEDPSLRAKAPAVGLATPRMRRALIVGLTATMIGSVAGPVLGVWMSLAAADRLPTGVAQTVCSLPPVFILPVVIFIEGAAPSGRAIAGAFVAVGGVVLLALGPSVFGPALAGWLG
ncbi:MAG: DMT family transporter [Planctomycetota bacterium]